MQAVPLPDWITEIRPHQVDAVNEIIEAYDSGTKVVFLDAPTGSGKTLIAELVRRELRDSEVIKRALYVASDLSLMDQFARDFPYVKAWKGRSNYKTQNNSLMTADDCTSRGPGSPCWFCDEHYMCPYQKAKQAAITAPLALTNTALLLTEANGPGRLSGQEFIIADEADTLEKMLMGYVEYNVSEKRINEFGMDMPGKGIHKPTMIKWLSEFSKAIGKKWLDISADPSDKVAKQLRRMEQLRSDTERIAMELGKEVAKKQESEGEGKWIRDYNKRDGGLVYKPVMVDAYGTRQLWRHGKLWLLMSATIISADEMADSLGLPLKHTTVKVPTTFPVENRPVILAPIANVIYKEMGKAIPRLIKAIGAVLIKHPNDRVLVHTVSYNLAKELHDGVKQLNTGRSLLTYTDGGARERVLAEYKKTPGAVMFAPSMGRGIDLPGDLCRVQVIAKVPFLSMGDPQVSRRMHMPGGDVWYAVQAIRDIVQMTGRAVRNKDDWAVTYIFDEQFSSNLWRKHKHLFPEWWRESVITNRSAKEFM